MLADACQNLKRAIPPTYAFWGHDDGSLVAINGIREFVRISRDSVIEMSMSFDSRIQARDIQYEI